MMNINYFSGRGNVLATEYKENPLNNLVRVYSIFLSPMKSPITLKAGFYCNLFRALHTNANIKFPCTTDKGVAAF